MHQDSSRSLRDSSGGSDHLLGGPIAGQVASRHSGSTGVQRAARRVRLGRSHTTAAVDEATDLAAAGDIPDHAGFAPLVPGCRRDAAADVGTGSGQANEANKDGHSKGLHDDN